MTSAAQTAETKHTPTPWAWERYEGGEFETERPTIFHVGDVRVVGDGDGRRGYDDHAPDEDDAAFIVRAVNNHQALVDALDALVNAKAISGVRKLVAGWNGEDRLEPYNERHPARLGATLPTNCGDVYALDEAMQSARAAIAKAEQP